MTCSGRSGWTVSTTPIRTSFPVAWHSVRRLARALVNEPSIMLLDEPLANLDGLTRIAMQAELIALWERQRFTAFLVTHDVDEALYLAGRVLVLSQRPARILADVSGGSAISAASWQPALRGIAPARAGGTGIAGALVNTSTRPGPDAHSGAKAEGDFVMQQDTDQGPKAVLGRIDARVGAALRRTSGSMRRQ